MYFIYLLLPGALGLNKYIKEGGELDIQLKSLATPLRPFSEPVKTVTEVSSQSETATATVTKKLTTGYEWSVGTWTRCDAECGTGIQRRKVECRHIVSKIVGDESICKQDFEIPASTQDCQGPCLSCPASHGDFFKRASLGQPVDPANFDVRKRDTYSLCQQQPDAFASCCNTENEDAIRSEVARSSKSLDDIMLAIPKISDVVAETLKNFTSTLELRKTETQMALNEVNAALGNGSADSTRTLPVLKEVLMTRLLYFQSATDLANKAVENINKQISSFAKNGESMEASCGRAALTFYAQTSCSACNVDFVEKYVKGSTIRVSEFDCEIVHKACRSSIAVSHGSLLSALRELSKIHAELRKQSMRIQPALARVWGSLKFSWIPGSIPEDINKNPDLTQLQCIRQSLMFDLPQINKAKDFCSLYISPFEAGTFASRLRQTLLQGKTSMDDILSCDACVHVVLKSLPALIIQSTEMANLELQFPMEDTHVCLMANRIPKSVSLISKMRTQLSLPSEPLQASLVESEDATLRPNAPLPIVFASKDGADVGVIGNLTSWDALVSVGKLIPPRPIWEPKSHGSAIQVWDKTCNNHEDCFNQGSSAGDAAWWFCASPVACKDTGTCSSDDENLLNKGPKCAKGPCIHGSQAVDGSCPEIAVCPAESPNTFFGPKYFSKLQTVQDDDGDAGVCDCAFSPSMNEAQFKVEDKCKHAACIAYAQAYEEQAACKLKLSDVCETLRSSGCDVACSLEAVAWTPPVCEYSFTVANTSSSEAISASVAPRSTISWLSFTLALGGVLLM